MTDLNMLLSCLREKMSVARLSDGSYLEGKERDAVIRLDIR